MRLRLLLLPAAILLLSACARQELQPTEAPQAPAQESFIPGQAIVLLAEDLADSFSVGDIPGAASELGILSAERVFPDAGEFEERHRAAGLHRWYSIRFDPGVSSTKAQGELSALPGVESVEIPRRKVRRAYFNDPYFSQQWQYANTGSMGYAFKSGIDINVEKVWDEYTTGSSEVIVAVVDGGIDLKHKDLSGVVLPGSSSGSHNFIAGYMPNQIPADDHGTHVAGIIGAINNNAQFGSGIAGGSDGRGGVRLMSCVIFAGTDEDPAGGTGEEEPQALVWAADHGAVIANNSWGYVFDSEEDAAAAAKDFETQDYAIKSAIDYFIANAGTDAAGNQTGPMKGGLVVFASGNTGWSRDVPSEYAPVVAVGAFGPDGKMSLYSSYGPWVDILAPGGSDSDDYREWILSLSADNTMSYMSGTSMACPHVSGVAALLVSYYGGPGFTCDELKERLLFSARENVIDLQGRSVGGGMLDAYGAFNYETGPVDPSQADIRISTDYSGDFRIKSHETLTVNYTITGNNRLRLPVRFESNCPGASATCTTSSAEVRIEALQAEPGSYTATLRVGSAARQNIRFTILENNAPQLVQAPANQILNAASASLASIDLSGCFSDPDGETLSYSVSTSSSDVVTARISGNTLSLTPAGYGQTQVNVTARDARGASCDAAFLLLARNTWQDLDVFPNPVSTVLNVRPGSDAHTTAALYSRNGARVLSDERQAGPFQPMQLDVRELPAGNYTLAVDFDGKQLTTNIVKY